MQKERSFGLSNTFVAKSAWRLMIDALVLQFLISVY